MTPREHIAQAVRAMTGAQHIVDYMTAARSGYEIGRMSRSVAQLEGAAAGHGFRALEILYDREQTAVQSARHGWDLATRWQTIAFDRQGHLDLARAWGLDACETITKLRTDMFLCASDVMAYRQAEAHLLAENATLRARIAELEEHIKDIGHERNER